MLILRKIVLQLGAIFLLVSLKTHGGLTRSVTNSDQLTEPDINSTSYGGIIRLSNSSDSALSSETSANETEDKDFNAQSEITTPTVNLTKNSSTAEKSQKLATNDSTDDIGEIEAIVFNQILDPDGANNNSIFSVSKRTNESYSHEKSILNKEQYDGNSFGDKSLDLKDYSATLEPRSENKTTASKRESLLAAGRRAIKNLGNDLKKLKSNVDSFKQNLRKILFETEIPIFQRNGSSSTSKSDTVVPTRFHTNATSSADDSSNARFYGSVSILEENEQNNSITAAPRVQTFVKISAAAANMSEASKRMGDFLKKQYWDSKGKYEQNAHDAMISRGKSFQ